MFHYNADSTDGEIVVPGTSKSIMQRFKRVAENQTYVYWC
jgi:hypothetical protein